MANGSVSWETIEQQWALLRDKGVKSSIEAFENTYKELVDACLEALERGDEEVPDEFYCLMRRVARDRQNPAFLLKGSLLLANVQENRSGKIAQGRRISRKKRDLELYRAIMSNDGSVSEFCQKWRITRTRYYRIRNIDVIHEEDVKLLEEIKKSVL